MVHLICINFRFGALKLLVLQKKCYVNITLYWKSQGYIYTIYIGIIESLFHFTYTNFEALLVINVINFKRILKWPSSLYAFHLQCECDYLLDFQFTTHLSYLCWKNSFFEMKIFKLVTWYPNMVQIIWNDMVNISSTFIKIFGMYLCFLVQRYITFVSTNILQSPTL